MVAILREHPGTRMQNILRTDPCGGLPSANARSRRMFLGNRSASICCGRRTGPDVARAWSEPQSPRRRPDQGSIHHARENGGGGGWQHVQQRPGSGRGPLNGKIVGPRGRIKTERSPGVLTARGDLRLSGDDRIDATGPGVHGRRFRAPGLTKRPVGQCVLPRRGPVGQRTGAFPRAASSTSPQSCAARDVVPGQTSESPLEQTGHREAHPFRGGRLHLAENSSPILRN